MSHPQEMTEAQYRQAVRIKLARARMELFEWFVTKDTEWELSHAEWMSVFTQVTHDMNNLILQQEVEEEFR